MSNSFDTIYSLRKRNLLVQGGKRKKPASGYSDILLTTSRGLDTSLSTSIPRQITQSLILQNWFNSDIFPVVSPGPVIGDAFGNFYIGNNSRITKVSSNGNILQEYLPPVGTVSSADGGWPWTFSGTQTVMDISDKYKNFIYRLDLSTSTFTYFIGSTSGASGFSTGLSGTSSLLSGPIGISRLQGGLIISQAGNNCISFYSFTPSQQRLITVAGSSGIPGYLDGIGTSARFNNPQGLFVDLFTSNFTTIDDVIIIDTNNNRIRKLQVNPTHLTNPSSPDYFNQVTTIAGSGQVGSLDGPALSATFNNPTTGCVNLNNGDYYIVDNGNLIRRIRNGNVSTILGPSNGLTFVTHISCIVNVLYISDQGSQTKPAAIYKFAV